jgi:NFU1 iron-sulfur cluster scaffold homolog, mitochondrial
MAQPRVTFQETPNPNAGKFSMAVEHFDPRRGRTYADAASAAGVPFAERLLADPDVVSVFAVADFVTVTKREGAKWKELAPRITAVLREALPR